MGRTSVMGVTKRPALLGLRDRHRDQRKKIIKMCVQKLRDIDDPETVLCRAVLINNTFRTLKTAQRQLLKNARRRIEEPESSEEEEAEEHEEDEDVEVTVPKTVEPFPVLSKLEPKTTPRSPEMEGGTTCELGYSTDTMVHSLVMPPLLSPHIEDMTNCSFYENFGPPDLTSVDKEIGAAEQFQLDREDVAASLKLTMMRSDLTEMVSESNRNSQTSFQFGGCGAAGGEAGESLLDNLLTEIAQA